MKRFFRWLKALFNRGMDKLEDPDMMLDQARRDMQEAMVSNREKAVQAITQRNRLAGMLDEARKKSAQLERQAETALKQGNRDLARQFIREKANNDVVLGQLEASHAQADEAVQNVKVAIKRQEEEVRRKTAEALALKAQWKQAQIQNSISKALEGLTFENQFEGFGAASERIKEAQAEVSARNEMMANSLQGKIMQMEDQSMDMEAEAELQKMEARLGMNQASTTQASEEQVVVTDGGGTASAEQTPEAPMSEIDKQLEELEKRVNPGS
ncbi:MAG: PspA/IM30 family protein [Fimbriimonadaceae bacterium]|nr:PspA/IM30 family protein [Fimbriimonadaceae bacterium]